MELIPAERTIDYPYLRLVSQNQVWEFGIGEMTIIGDIRIVAGRVGSGEFEIIYYAGQDKGMAIGVLAQVLIIMNAMPETISCEKFRAAFPVQTKGTMIEDFECWQALSEMTESVVTENSIQASRKIFLEASKLTKNQQWQ